MTETRITPQTNRINDADVCVIPDHIVKAGNSKMSEYVAVVNVPALFTCPADAPCRQFCYACKGNYNLFQVRQAPLQSFMCQLLRSI